MIRLPRALFLVPLLLALALPMTGRAASATLNLKDADINTLIATVSEITGKNFIVDARVKGKVTVISARPMTPGGIYETFLGVLQVNGFAAIPDGQAIKIVPETNARTDGGALLHSGKNLPIDDIVTHVMTLNNVSASQMVPILRPLMATWAHLAAYTPGNQLILSDRAANVQRIERIIKQMDQASDRTIELVKLQNAAASEVVRTLTALSQQDKTADPSTRSPVILADERSNSVLVGGDKTERQKILEIIQQLDQPLKDDGATQVIYLRYASAESLAPILQGYAQQASQAKPGAGAAAATAPAGGASASGEVSVLADKDTNSLIVTASPKVMRQVRDVIAQLDIQRAQILVEAVIAEVSAEKSSQLGVDWAVFNQDRIAAASILTPTTTGALSGVATAGNSALLGLIGQGATIGGGVSNSSGTSFAVILRALQGDGDSNVLSTPTLVTLDNQEAKFSAGQEVPFLTGSFSNTGTGGTGGSVNPFQTIERKDVGLTLGVTPQINEGNHIKLKLDLEVSSLSSGTAGGANLITNKRTLTNTVGVENGQILVIGGLIDDQLQDTQSGVPFLSSIPFLGNLFKYRSVNKTKRNLMLFVRPSILRTLADGDYYTRRKYDAVRQAQIDASSGPVPLVGGRHPLLIPMNEYGGQLPPQPAPTVPIGSASPPDAAGNTPSSVTAPEPPADSPAAADATLPATEPAPPRATPLEPVTDAAP